MEIRLHALKQKGMLALHEGKHPRSCCQGPTTTASDLYLYLPLLYNCTPSETTDHM